MYNNNISSGFIAVTFFTLVSSSAAVAMGIVYKINRSLSINEQNSCALEDAERHTTIFYRKFENNDIHRSVTHSLTEEPFCYGTIIVI